MRIDQERGRGDAPRSARVAVEASHRISIIILARGAFYTSAGVITYW